MTIEVKWPPLKVQKFISDALKINVEGKWAGKK